MQNTSSPGSYPPFHIDMKERKDKYFIQKGFPGFASGRVFRFSRRLLYLLTLPLVSCSLLGPEQVLELQLPDKPAGLPYVDFTYSLQYADSRGAYVTLSGIGPGARIKISVPRRINLPLLALPESCGGIPPAGAVWPWSEAKAGRLYLTWEEGFAASLILELYFAGYPVERINFPRLQEELIASSCGDPWRVEEVPLLEAFWYGTMRRDKIKVRKEMELVLPVSRGLWCAGNPGLKNRFVSAPEGRGCFTVYEGFFSFFHESGQERLDIYVDDKGWAAVNPFTGFAESGSW